MIDTETRVPGWWTAGTPRQRSEWIRRHPEIAERRQRIASLAVLASTIRPEWAEWPMDQRIGVATQMIRDGATVKQIRDATGLSDRRIREMRAAVVDKTESEPVTWREVAAHVQDGLTIDEIHALIPGARRDKVGFAVRRARRMLRIEAATGPVCRECGREKPASEFSPRRDKPNVIAVTCDPCRAKARERRADQPGRKSRTPSVDPTGATRWCSRCKGMRPTGLFRVLPSGETARNCDRCLDRKKARRGVARGQ